MLHRCTVRHFALSPLLLQGASPNRNKDLYGLLGVQRGASQDEIKKAYREKTKKLHPDVNPSPKAAEEFAEINGAYDTLKDPQKRSMYDMTGNAGAADGMGGGGGFNPFAHASGGNPFAQGFPGAGGPGGMPGFDSNAKFNFNDFEDVFEKMTGQKQSQKKRPTGPEPGSDIHFKLQLSFAEAVTGVTKEISYNTMRKCTACNGTASKDGEAKTKCSNCNGRGKVVMSTGFFHMQQDCPQCSGEGETFRAQCAPCSGKGVVKDRTTQQLPVPRGVDNNERLKVVGKGEAGVRGGPPGNLYVEVFVDEDPIFMREGLDIHVVVPVPLVTALLGGTVRVPTLTESEIEIRVPPGTQQGDKQVIRGRGVTRPNQNKQGDLYIHAAILLPEELSAKQKELLEEFSKTVESGPVTDKTFRAYRQKFKSWVN